VASAPLLAKKCQVPIDVLSVGGKAYRVGQKAVAGVMVDGNGPLNVRRRIGEQMWLRTCT
jgi:hypothetical protein